MKEKTSITLSSDVLAKVDDLAGSKISRSALIEDILRGYFRERSRRKTHARDHQKPETRLSPHTISWLAVAAVRGQTMKASLGLGFAALLSLSLLAAWLMAAPSARAQTSKDLQIYFVDVEGGQATLFVTPAGQSLLIDTGWPDFNGRDADRIVAAAKKAGVTKIDYVLITHFHADHVGGAPQLADRIPIGTFIDHGELRETTDAPTVMVEGAYRKLLATGKYQHLVPKPGDTLPIEGMQATVVSADAATIVSSLPGGGQENAACKDAPKYPEDKTENRRSLGTVINFGKLRIVDLGDLTHDEEVELMCPVNKLGHADIYIVSHHGWDQSSSPALVWGLAPRVAIMDNGAKKGGSPSVWDIIEKSPGLENLWQLHFSDEGGAAHNVAEEFIANPQGTDAANYLEVIAHPDGSFAVFNSRTGKTKEYPARFQVKY